MASGRKSRIDRNTIVTTKQEAYKKIRPTLSVIKGLAEQKFSHLLFSIETELPLAQFL